MEINIQLRKCLYNTKMEFPQMTYSLTKNIIPFFAYSHYKETQIYWFTFCHLGLLSLHSANANLHTTHYPQNFRPDTCKYWEIQISKLYALVWWAGFNESKHNKVTFQKKFERK